MQSRAALRRAAGFIAAIWLTASPSLAGPYDDPGYSVAAAAAWATSVQQVVRGPMDVAEPEIGDASHGVEANVIGPALGDIYTSLSLGDGGTITLHFDSGIQDLAGPDLAIFENGFWAGGGGLFAEFAYVEVSTDGLAFARFASTALHPTPVLPQGAVDPTDYHNLAGDQPIGLGTGFDLAELNQHPLTTSGDLDLSNVRFVRLIDVIGDASTSDFWGSPIHDPYPTLYYTGGFDLDGVGVLHPVPEPSRIVALAAGLLLLAALGRPACESTA